MIASPPARKPRRGDYVTVVVRLLRPRQATGLRHGQLVKIEDATRGRRPLRLYHLRRPDAGGVIVISSDRVAEMFRHPGPIVAGGQNR